ncbi:hypothetical protein DUNSADRAFT_9352, partial [Dunaliella salina]
HYTLSPNGLLIPPPMQSTSPERHVSPTMLRRARSGADTCHAHAGGIQHQASSHTQQKQLQDAATGVHLQGDPLAPDHSGAGANTLVLHPKFEAVMQSAPQFGFGRSPRWPDGPVGVKGAKKGGWERNGERARSRSPPQHEQRSEGQGKAKTKEDLDVVGAYKAVLPHKAATSFSKTPRFAQPAALRSTSEEQQQQKQQGGQGEEGGPQQKRPRTAPATKVCTPGVQAAIDFVKGRHSPAVTFGGPSVKEQLQQERAQRKLQLEQQRAVQEQRIHAGRAHTQPMGREGHKGTGMDLQQQQPIRALEQPLHLQPPTQQHGQGEEVEHQQQPLQELKQGQFHLHQQQRTQQQRQQQEQGQAGRASAVMMTGGLAGSPDPVGPGVASSDIVYPGVASPDHAQPGVASSDPVRPGVASSDIARPVVASPDPMRPVVASPDPVRPVVASPDPVRPGVASSDPMRPVVASPDPVQPGVASPDPMRPAVASPDPMRPDVASPDFVHPDAGEGGGFQALLAHLQAARAAFLMEVESAEALCVGYGDAVTAAAAPMEVGVDAHGGPPGDAHGGGSGSRGGAAAAATPMEVEVDAASGPAADAPAAATGLGEGSNVALETRAESLGAAAQAQMLPAECTNFYPESGAEAELATHKPAQARVPLARAAVLHSETRVAGTDVCNTQPVVSAALDAAVHDPAALAAALRAAAEAEAEQQAEQQGEQQAKAEQRGERQAKAKQRAEAKQQAEQQGEQQGEALQQVKAEQRVEQQAKAAQRQQQQQEPSHFEHPSQASTATSDPIHPGRRQTWVIENSGPGGPGDGGSEHSSDGRDPDGGGPEGEACDDGSSDGDISDDDSSSGMGSVDGSGGGDESGSEEGVAGGNGEELQTAARIALERHLRVQEHLQAQQRRPNISQHYLRLRRSSSSHAAPQRSISAPRASTPTPSFALVHRRAPTPTFGPPPPTVPRRHRERLRSPARLSAQNQYVGPSHMLTPLQTAAVAAAAAEPDSQHHPSADAAAARRSLSAGPVLRRSFVRGGTRGASSRELSPRPTDTARRLRALPPKSKGDRARKSLRESSPGPGDYAVEDDRGLRGVVSTARRPPSAPFSAVPRMPEPTGGSWRPGLKSLLAWRKSDVGGALDKLKTR